MWLNAQRKLRGELSSLGARLIDSAVPVDQGTPLATFITMPRWLLTGKKDRLWGIFPPSGVSEKDIAGASRLGRAIAEALSRSTPATWGAKG